MPTNWKHVIAMAAAMAGAAAAQAQVPVEGPVATHATVHVETKNGADLQAGGLKVEVDGRPVEVLSVRRVVPARAQIVILIDDGLRSSFGLQIADLKKFVLGLPAGTQVMVGYMRNGSVITAGGDNAGFSTELASVAQQIRIPNSMAGASASPYFCLSDLVKHWPSADRGPRFVMMLTNGVDPYNGSTSIMNQSSPYVEEAQNDAQRAGVTVYAISYSDAGYRGGSATFSGQSYLAQVAQATGGRSLWNGTGNPVSLAPFLSDFRKSIFESYVVSFNVNARSSHEKRPELIRVKIAGTQKGVKVHGPDGVVAGW